jgi:hypothetical protein
MMLIAMMERFRAITPLPIGAAKLACGSKESNPPFPFPPREKPGRGAFPPTPEARCAPAKSAVTHRCGRLPPQEGCRPLVYPPLRSVSERGGNEDNRVGVNQLRRRYVYTNILTTQCDSIPRFPLTRP